MLLPVLLTLLAPQGDAPPGSAIAWRARPFGPESVRLLDGPFRRARDLDAEHVLSLDPDRLLARFRREAGLPPRAEGYGGWEAETLGGHTLGHTLSALAKLYAGTGDERFRARAAYLVAELAACQKAGGDGYIAAIPGGHAVFDAIARGDIRSANFDLNGLWAPWYVIHKQMAGLRDVWLHCHDERALAVLRGLGDWALAVTGGLDAAQLDLMLRCEHGGMNEVAADLYGITGEPRWLELAERFTDHRVLDPLARGEDVLPGLHGNTQIPKLIGAARRHELTGDAAAGAAAEFFWRTVVERHSYANGGNTLNEYFGPPATIGARLAGNTTECCNTYNMLRLTRSLHGWTADARRMDYYERALYGQVLASQDPANGAVCYFLPLAPGARKEFQSLDRDFTCCVATGMESHASYGDALYWHDDDGLLVALFLASELSWPARGLRLVQRTRFPDEPASVLELSLAAPLEFDLRVRWPGWAEEGFAIRVNGTPAPLAPAPGRYVSLRRTWHDGDRVEIDLPLRLRLEPTPDDPAVAALFAGPVLLAGVLGAAPPAAAGAPCLVVESRDPAAWLERLPGRELAFRSAGAVRPREVEVRPYFRVVHEHANVYWPVLAPAEWAARGERLRAIEARRRALAARTTDFVQPGEPRSEHEHALAQERSNSGLHEGLSWRDAHHGGWFGYTLRVPAAGSATLLCTYWGGDAGGREFEIRVDGTPVGTQVLDRACPGEFFDVAYPLAEELTRGKTEVRVEFRAAPGRLAGGVFGVRMLRDGE